MNTSMGVQFRVHHSLHLQGPQSLAHCVEFLIQVFPVKPQAKNLGSKKVCQATFVQKTLRKTVVWTWTVLCLWTVGSG